MNSIFHALFQKTRFLNKELNETLKVYDLFAAQWSVLFCIQQHGEMTLTQIWKYLNVEAPTITRTVNRLVKLGWLETAQGRDRREKIVRLTTDAMEKFQTIETAIYEVEKEMLKNLSVEEQKFFISVLNKIGG